MKSFNCVIIEDEKPALALMQSYVERLPFLNLLAVFDDAIAGKDFLQNNAVDLLFTDIQMPDMSGLALYRSLKNPPQVIFTTAFKDFAVEGFELEALDYILKPAAFDRVERAVQRFLRNKGMDAEKATADHFFVRSAYQKVKIETAEIEYIEGLEDYVRIHVKNTRPVMTQLTLKALQERLPAKDFHRIHRSYIVPRKQIRSILNKKITLHNGAVLPIGDSFAASLEAWLSSTSQ